jgi:DNA-binding MarR family transcriptional regulator
MYRLLGNNHALVGLPFSAQVFLRALDGVRNHLATQAGISGLELRALSRVAEQSGLTADELGEFLELSPGPTSTIVISMMTHELIDIVAPTANVGLVLVLTPKGHEVVSAMYLGFQQAMVEAASTLDEERRWGLESGMLKMARKLEQQTANASLT